MGNNYYFGKIVRSQGSEKYQITKDNFLLRKLRSILPQKERVVETGKDITYFLIKLNGALLTVLMQIGVGKAGMGKLRDFLKEIMGREVDDFSTKSITKSKVNVLQSLKDKRIKSIRLRFRRNPEMPEDINIKKAVNDLQALVNESFYIDINIDVGKLGSKKIQNIPIFKDVYNKFFGRDIKPNEIDINFPEFLENFDVDYIKEGKIEFRKEKILELFEKTQINIKLTEENDDEIAKALLKSFKEKIS